MLSFLTPYKLTDNGTIISDIWVAFICRCIEIIFVLNSPTWYLVGMTRSLILVGSRYNIISPSRNTNIRTEDCTAVLLGIYNLWHLLKFKMKGAGLHPTGWGLVEFLARRMKQLNGFPCNFSSYSSVLIYWFHNRVFLGDICADDAGQFNLFLLLSWI